ncbi:MULTISPECIES: hypothetical protein [Photobacterium]|jgi:hypothetical protein|uniref:Uncharacterized protein n=2 Tax=Photobacterium TaxID=657 RepID=A0A0D8PQR0_9GAMM|nr:MULTISPECIES: hypothetical protein [Photobacterium]KJG12467.1 hypothetical protein UB38_15340 [Photobacterium iliopiscarium]KJG20885.1 hypothetical protein UB37_12655 [Photobacterium iliopiscarium]MBY3787993.1 hypothetical protein [Photobacterium carnosum]MCD9465682.1 hypothetical protein [Photobacterium iliopiscarium]MCD9485625.1 hypothetical protein [Photobacterium iliopiscarium]
MDQAKGLRNYFVDNKRQDIFIQQEHVRQLIIQKQDKAKITASLIELEKAWIEFEHENNQ